MLPIVHLMSSLGLAGFLLPFIGWKAIFIVIGGYLIDADHYLYWIFYHKKFSLKENYWWHKKDKARDELHLFHTAEVWLLLVLLSFYIDVVLYFTIGLIYHLIFDFLNIYIDKLYGRRSLSIITWTFRRFYKEKQIAASYED